ncbi:DHH family phosphoesterase [Gorillibacterium timonense]|uniref:DHH family phosphoesterase n=1 Tax=Gorillibacterium timonense TaxID=1689269 RepID=UPI00071C23C1|nr:bifunctional oligoribonuclease/PAP phosphatase NrnA [Gorillibacterium timonense]
MSASKALFSEQLKEAARFLREGDDFLVVSHVNPDGDAISSTLAVGEILTQLGKRFTMINDSGNPTKFAFLAGDRIILNDSLHPSVSFKQVVTVDCADYARVGKVMERIPEGTPLLNIDHHRTNDGFGTVQLLHPDAAATAEILYSLINELSLTWNRELATFIYTGMLTDTGGFRYANTNPEVMKIASELLQWGVPGSELAVRLLERLTLSQVRLLQKGLGSLSFSHGGKIAWICISHSDIEELGATSDDMDNLVNYPRNIEGVDVGILFKEMKPGIFKVSLRSAGEVNVAEVASFFGGGGHIRAAGCTVTGSLEEVVADVVREAGKAWA